MTQFTQARLHMVQSQLATNGVTDPAVLEAFAHTPRELFVPKDSRPFCYTDKEINLGQGRFMLEPMVLARLIQALAPQKTDKALVVGGTTGYGAAVLAQRVAQVDLVEETEGFKPLYEQARDDMELSNVAYRVGQVEQETGHSHGYDLILVEGATPDVPSALTHHLRLGGRMAVIVVPDGMRMGHAMYIQKSTDGFISSRSLFDAFVPYLPCYAPLPRFALA